MDGVSQKARLVKLRLLWLSLNPHRLHIKSLKSSFVIGSVWRLGRKAEENVAATLNGSLSSCHRSTAGNNEVCAHPQLNTEIETEQTLPCEVKMLCLDLSEKQLVFHHSLNYSKTHI